MKFSNMIIGAVLAALAAFAAGCSYTEGNEGKLAKYLVGPEPAWIQNGEPIEFEGARWIPQDGFDVLLDSEVVPQGEYRGISFFTARVDVRPFDRLYTKLDRNKFRVFSKEK